VSASSISCNSGFTRKVKASNSNCNTWLSLCIRSDRDLGMKAKRRIQQRMVEFVRRQASQEASERQPASQQNPPVAIQ